jgi:hypothetical protein
MGEEEGSLNPPQWPAIPTNVIGIALRRSLAVRTDGQVNSSKGFVVFSTSQPALIIQGVPFSPCRNRKYSKMTTLVTVVVA